MGNIFQNFFKFPICSNLKFKRSRQFVTVFSIEGVASIQWILSRMIEQRDAQERVPYIDRSSLLHGYMKAL